MKFTVACSFFTRYSICIRGFIVTHFKCLVVGRNSLQEAQFNISFPIFPSSFFTFRNFLKVFVITENPVVILGYPNHFLAMHSTKCVIVMVVKRGDKRLPYLFVDFLLQTILL